MGHYKPTKQVTLAKKITNSLYLISQNVSEEQFRVEYVVVPFNQSAIHVIDSLVKSYSNKSRSSSEVYFKKKYSFSSYFNLYDTRKSCS